MAQLPIDAVLADITTALQSGSQLILKAPPGAGKSTQLPLHLLRTAFCSEKCSGKIILLEPRRLAARNIARYLASQLGEEVGQTVGLRMRGENKVSSQTQLEIVTEGVMTKMLQQDPELNGIELLIFDEFHERSIHTDTALALALEVQEALRDDLKILLMSATLDQQALQNLLPEAHYIESQGRCYPIEYRYQALRNIHDLTEQCSKAILQLLRTETGSILVFLPGVGEIKRVEELLQQHDLGANVVIAPLYGQQSLSAQQQAIMPTAQGQRKVVLATNIAETSLTIEGIRLVIDCGLERIAQWDGRSGISRLELVKIAQSSAEQRAGRAGRLEPGICVRLYSEEQLSRQPIVPIPEIQRADLTSLALELAQWGCRDISDLQWLTLPPKSSMQAAYQLLSRLGLCQIDRQLTELGQRLYQLGTDPRHGLMLLQGEQLTEQGYDHGVATAALLVALLENPPKGVNNPDLAFVLNLLDEKKLAQGGSYLQRAQQYATKFGHKIKPGQIHHELIAVILAAGYPDRIAKARTQLGRYGLANGQGAMINDDEKLAGNDYLVVADLVRTQQGDSRIFSAVAADISLLEQYLPYLFERKSWLDWDEKKGRLTAEERLNCGQLIVSTKALPEPSADQTAEALLNAVRRKGLSCLPWNEASQNLLVRARNAQHWNLNLTLPDLCDNGLLQSLDQWLAPYLQGINSFKALAKLNLVAALEAYIGWEAMQQLNLWLPTHYQVPTGSNIRLRYELHQPPVLAVKLQEMFGEPTSPSIANGQVRLVLELLSPAQRPLQITQDLAAFWQGSYREVQKEMKGRYPKHPWPDDPASHIPTRKTKRQL
ncbi:TPA: ATP-dependent helicase HrpB [Photobacterium damselae]